jgi:septal ring factor EnvC (AmiA/AmiB activator)
MNASTVKENLKIAENWHNTALANRRETQQKISLLEKQLEELRKNLIQLKAKEESCLERLTFWHDIAKKFEEMEKDNAFDEIESHR